MTAMISPGVHLWAAGRVGLAGGLRPEAMAALAPSWADDARRSEIWAEPAAGKPEATLGMLTSNGVGSRSPVIVCGDCASGMDVAWSLAAEDLLPPFAAVLATTQTSGRGQLRRAWHSPAGNLHLAWLLPKLPAQFDNLASLLAGYALCSALRAHERELRIKWPNDLMLAGRKVGGVLVEERGGRVLVGFGLNLAASPPDELLRQGHAVSAGSLARVAREFGPLSLWLSVADAARAEIERALGEPGPAPLIARIEELLQWRGEMIRVQDGDCGEVHGRVLGLAPDGGLRILRDVEESVLYSGSVLPLY